MNQAMHTETTAYTAKELSEYWRNKFIERYEKEFGIKIDLEKYNEAEEDETFIYCVYGVKSPWL